MKIILVMTGGTICSYRNEEGLFSPDGVSAVPKLAEGVCGVEFDVRPLMNTLSENMTFGKLDRIIGFFRDLPQCEADGCDGVIIAHGTDTLAYSASLLAVALAGFSKPVSLVSSNFVLDLDGANGRVNFRAAVDLIKRGFGCGVYVPYMNSDGVVYLHKGAHLRQCGNYSNDFYSCDMVPVDKASAYPIPDVVPVYRRLPVLRNCVMFIEPYVGLDYSAVRLSGDICAVLHGSYHSATACVERASRKERFTSFSVLHLLRRCKKRGIDFWLNGFADSENFLEGVYTTTADLILSGAKPVSALTNETAFMKLSIAYSLGYSGEEVDGFMKYEFASEKVIVKE